MISLHNVGIGAGASTTQLEVDPEQISSLAADPNEASRTVVTMQNGTWFLVAESVEEIKALLEGA